eukprot:12899894-Prorocentrum_lima.AAC.1
MPLVPGFPDKMHRQRKYRQEPCPACAAPHPTMPQLHGRRQVACCFLQTGSLTVPLLPSSQDCCAL